MKYLFYLFLFIPFQLFAEQDLRNKVVVLDTGIDVSDESLKPYICKTGHFGIFNPLYDTQGHGTTIAKIISNYIDKDKTCILSYKWIYDYDGFNDDLNKVLKHLHELKDNTIKVINLSFGGKNKDKEEYSLIKQLLKNNIKVVAAAGNKSTDLGKSCNYFPACYKFNSKNFYVVTSTNTIQRNYGGPAIYKEDGKFKGSSGTSLATAVKTGKLAKEME